MARDSFTLSHPIVNFAYFGSVLGCSMFILHPYLLAISLVSALLYSISLVGAKKVLRFNLLFSLPGLFVIMGINPLFNHFGVTQLLLLKNGNSITLEAIVYGMILGLVLVIATNWFTSINQVLTRDKFIDVFGRILPTIALLLALSFRFIPLFITQFKKVLQTQETMNSAISEQKGLKKIKHILAVTSAMFSWSLENAIHTSDAMQLRAYGSHKRSLYLPHKFDPRNWTLLAIILALTTVVVTAKMAGYLEASYNPVITVSSVSGSTHSIFTAVSLSTFALLANIPLLLRGYDYVLHKRQRSRSLALQKD